MQRRVRSRVAVLTVLALLLPAFPSLAAPAGADITGHWAESAIRQLIEKGVVSGLPDGTFQPELTVTRAEFVTMVNKSLGLTPASGPSRFTDVQATDWFGGQVEAAAQAGYVTGNPDGTFSPNRPITREQAAAMLVRAFGFPKLATVAEQDAALALFSDAGSVSAWAKADLATAVSLGLISGYTPTTLAAKPASLTDAGWRAWEAARTTEQRQAVLAKYGSAGLITRAQTAVVIVRALAQKPAVEATVFDKAGTYGPDTGVETITGDVTVTSDAVTLRNTVISGDLTIAESVGDGTVTLENVTVKGNTEVKGGGTNSVIFRNCTLHGTVTVEKEDGKIRIVAEGSTSVPKVVLQSGAILVSTDDGSFERVVLPEDLETDTEIVLAGNFGEVEIAAEKANVKINEGSKVVSLVLTDNATNSKVDLAENASVTTVTTNAKVEITGKGSIGTAEINVDGVTIEPKPDKIDWGEDVETAIIAGETEKAPVTSSGGGGGGGGSTQPDTTAPTVASTDPANNATGVAADKTITVTFSENVQQGASFDEIALNDVEGTAVDCSVSLNGKVLTIDPSADLAYRTRYTVTIPAAAVKDAAGNTLVADCTFSFTTVASEDTFTLSYRATAALPADHPQPTGCVNPTFVNGSNANLEAGKWYYTAITVKKNVSGDVSGLQFQISGVPNEYFDTYMYDFGGRKWYQNTTVWGSGFTASDDQYNTGVTTYIFIYAKKVGTGNVTTVLKDIAAEPDHTLSNTLTGSVRVHNSKCTVTVTFTVQ